METVTHRSMLLIGMLCIAATGLRAQRMEVYDNAVVRDSVNAAIMRDLATGLWAADITSGALAGQITLQFTIDFKGRATSVFVSSSTLSIPWRNAVKDHWYDHRFDIRLPKGHTEKVDVHLHFP
jgi:hypothetical protein